MVFEAVILIKYPYYHGIFMRFVNMNTCGLSGTENCLNAVAGVGWYILGEDQQNVGPYAISELRGKFYT